MAEEFESTVSKQGERHIINVPKKKRKKFLPGTDVKVKKMKNNRRKAK